MICELCWLDTDIVKECEHTKNGYCGLFLKQAELDKKKFGPKNYRTLADLHPNDVFRYKGSDENDWHKVIRIDDEKLYYPGYLADQPQSNYRTDNVEVILK